MYQEASLLIHQRNISQQIFSARTNKTTSKANLTSALRFHGFQCDAFD